MGSSLTDTALQMETDGTCTEQCNAQELTSELESEMEMDESFAVPRESGAQLQEQSFLQEPFCKMAETNMDAAFAMLEGAPEEEESSAANSRIEAAFAVFQDASDSENEDS